MALFTASQYTTTLGVTNPIEMSFVDGVLVEIQRYIASLGLTFYTSTTKTKKRLQGLPNGQCIFDTYYWQKTLSTPVVTIKNISDNSTLKTLIADVDYWTSAKLTNSNAVYQIETKTPVYDSQRLEIDAVWGFDSSSSNSYLDIENAILGYIQARLMSYRSANSNLDNEGRELTSEKVLGKISLNYGSSSSSQEQLKSTFNNVIKMYL